MHSFTSLTGRSALVAGALLAVGASAAQAAPTSLSDSQNPTTVAAHGSTVVWSERNPETGDFRLVRSVAGGAAAVIAGVAESDEPFDVDLGTGRNGALQAVYTREGIIHRLWLSTGREQRLQYISLGGTNSSPTIHRGRIAFIHGERRRDSLRYTTRIDRKPRSLGTGVFNDVELGRKHLAYTEYTETGSRRLLRVHVRNTSTGRDRVVYRASSGALSQANVTRPSATADGTAFVWARTNVGSGTGNRVVRYTLRTGRLSYAPGTPRYASTAWTNDTLGLAYSTALDPVRNGGCEDAGVKYCGVGLTGPLTFDARP